MGYSKIAKIQAQDNASINRSLLNIITTLNDIIDNPIINGILIENVTVNTSQTSIEHKLKRPYKGFVVVSQNANANIWVAADSDKQAYLKLISSATVVVSLWVF